MIRHKATPPYLRKFVELIASHSPHKAAARA
jgi:hypothetical protein